MYANEGTAHMTLTPTNDSTGDDAAMDARERFVDAVLSIALTTDDAQCRARIEAALQVALWAAAQEQLVLQQNRSRGFFAQLRWAGLAAAAVLTLALIVWPSASGSSELLAAAALVEQQIADRSFDFRIDPPPFRREAPPLFGQLDVRSQSQMRLLLDYPDGSRILKGRDGDRSWMRDRDGTLREGTDVKWPGWVASADGSLVVDSMASLIGAIDARYDIAAPQATTLASGVNAVKITAALRQSVDASGAVVGRRGFDPISIAVWLDPSSRRVLRAEVKWDPPVPQDDAPARDGPPRDAPPRDGAPPRGGPPRDSPPPRDGPPRDGPPPRDGGPPQRPPVGGARAPELSSGVPGQLTMTLMSEKTFPEGYFAPERHALPK